MERMIKIRDDFLRNEQERREQERKEQEQPRAAPLPAAAPKKPRNISKRHADSLPPSIQSIPQNRTSETPCIPQNAEEIPISMPIFLYSTK